MNVYMDGVFDLFHRGHLEAIKKTKLVAGKTGRVIIGVVSDEDTKSYKRNPIISEEDRVEIIKNIKNVDQVIFPCPLVVTKQFLEKHNIDVVVHGFSNKDDFEKQKDYFKEIIEAGKFKYQEYYQGTSTSDIIKVIKSRDDL
tara:strand:- start:375 stop:800 length:426 start_codon:yes stop_codon:yes gene_type:complete